RDDGLPSRSLGRRQRVSPGEEPRRRRVGRQNGALDCLLLCHRCAPPKAPATVLVTEAEPLRNEAVVHYGTEGGSGRFARFSARRSHRVKWMDRAIDLVGRGRAQTAGSLERALAVAGSNLIRRRVEAGLHLTLRIAEQRWRGRAALLQCTDSDS